MSLYETYLSKSKEYLINEILKSWEINQKLHHQLEIQTKRVENLKKSNEFYANRRNWMKQTQTTNGLITSEDQWDGKFKVGGKFARSCQAIDQELEKELEGVK